MKKTLIALTLATLPVAASADVVLYGVIKGGVEVNRNFTNNKVLDLGKKGTSTKIVDYGSRIGFKGHEDISNNLRAIWQLEQDVNIGGGDGTKFGNRDSFVGLKDKRFGIIKAGHLSTPVKDINGRLDQWEYSDSAAGLDTYTRSNEAVRRATAISYETPDFSGFTAQAYVSPSDNHNGNETSFFNNNKEGEKAIYGAKVAYQNGPTGQTGFFAEAAGTYVKNSKYAPANKDGFQAAANVGYEANNWLAGVGYQQGRYVDNLETISGETVHGASVVGTSGTVTTINDSSIKRSQEVVASAAYTVNNALRLKGSAAYGFGIKGQVSTTTGGTTTVSEFDKAKYTQGIVGADYLLSKRTALNGQVGYLEFKQSDAKVKKGTVGVGMSHKF